MTTAESIVREYLERGYSLDALRLLAESGREELGPELLAIIDGMTTGAGALAAGEDSGPCETAAYPVVPGGENFAGEGDMLCFVADDEEDVSEEYGHVDQNASRGDPAAEEESVAEILIGETAGSGIVPAASGNEESASLINAEAGKAAGLIAAEAGREETGILTRLWSRVAAKATPAMSRHEALFEASKKATRPEPENNTENEPVMADESTIADVAGSEMYFEAVAEESSVVAQETAEAESVPAADNVEGDEEKKVESMENQAGPEAAADESATDILKETALECGVSPRMTATESSGCSEQAEMSADYLPGAMSELYADDVPPPLSIEEAKRALLEAQAQLSDDGEAEATPETTMEAEKEPASENIPAVFDETDASRQESRKERRKRERSRKKKEKKAAASERNAPLPEIVLTRSEGTETLSPEDAGDNVADAVAGTDGACLPALASDVAPGANDDEEAANRDKPAAPRMSEPMSLLTPSDLLGDDSEAAALFGYEHDGEAVAEENARAAGTENPGSIEAAFIRLPVSDAMPPEAEDEDGVWADAGDHLMIIAGGGVAAGEYADYVSADADADEAEAVADDFVDGGEEANIILFSEKFPVFSGVRADGPDDMYDGDDVSEEMPAASFLRMLPAVSSGESDEAEELAAPVHSVLRLVGGVETAEDDGGVQAESDDSALSGEVLLFMNQADDAVADAVVDEAENVAESTVEEEAAATTGETCLTLAEAAETSETPEETVQSEAAAVHEPEAVPEPLFRGLDENEKGVLFRALYGDASAVAADSLLDDADAVDLSLVHAIVGSEPEAAASEADLREAAVRAELETEYRGRLDEFAARILQVQTSAAADAEKLRQKQTELEARSAIIDEMQKRLDAEAMRCDEIAGRLAAANSKLDEKDGEVKSRDRELEFYAGMKDEHERLYNEFEDLRRGYNEIVGDVLPKLQGERDDLAVTVERQCANEERMRVSLGTVRKRMAVGYSLAGAACLALCALPVANWIKSGGVEREMATERQKLAELHESLQREVQGNIAARNTIVELENKVSLARAQLTDLHKKNQELAKLSRNRQAQMQQVQGGSQDVAVFKPPAIPAAGIPARASDMALQATTSPGQRLHVNQVRDPSGSIEELAMQNRQQNRRSDQMAAAGMPLPPAESSRASAPIALSSVSRQDTGGALRPGGGQAPTARATASGAKIRTSVASASSTKPGAKPSGKVVKVKKGEGVAQVVYRALGTWDPEVIAWVVKENKLALDKKGNPRIHPDQELLIPQDGRSIRSASAR